MDASWETRQEVAAALIEVGDSFGPLYDALNALRRIPAMSEVPEAQALLNGFARQLHALDQAERTLFHGVLDAVDAAQDALRED